jgi:hypothetical protein
VKAFKVTDSSDTHQHGQPPGFPVITELASFQAFDSGTRDGVSVGGVSTLTGADIVTTPASRAVPRIRRFSFRPSDGTFALTTEFRAFSSRSRGANVAVSGVQALPVFADIVQPGLGIGAVGQVWLRPDLETLRVLPWQPTLASDPVLLAALGDDLAHAYLAVKRAESAELSGLALADEVVRLVEAY